MRSGANFPPIVARKIFYVGVLEFLKTKPDSYIALVYQPLEVKSEGNHYKLTVTFNIGIYTIQLYIRIKWTKYTKYSTNLNNERSRKLHP